MYGKQARRLTRVSVEVLKYRWRGNCEAVGPGVATRQLDTNVVSEMRRLINPNLADWAHTLDPAEAYLSAITIQELEIGVQLKERRDKHHGLILRQWLEQHVYPTFEGRILPVDVAVARRSAAFHIPNPAPLRDSLIAATALEHRMVLVTRNVSDFERTGVQIFNPF